MLGKIYALNLFQNQAYYPFDDHEAPPLNMIFPLCEDIDDWFKQNPQNVAAIHCKAGKARTGAIICCYLIYSNFVFSSEKAVKYFGIMRTYNGKGVTIPSQIRYVQFFEEIIKRKILYPVYPPRIRLKNIKFNNVPNFNLLSEGL